MANTQLAQKPKFSMTIKSSTYQRLIEQTLGSPKRAERYTAAIMSAVATNPQLQECEAKTILSGSLLAETLNLAHSPQLGQYYLVPFKAKEKKVKDASGDWRTIPEHYDATFVLGYKGYLQLAIRSGFYKKINVTEIKEGELISYNPFDEDIVLDPIQDVDEREAAKTIGYYAMFEYLNGFKKTIYWTKKQMLRHADRYSAAFSLNATGGRYPKVSYEDFEAGRYDKKDEWLYSSFWYKDFDGMAKKTMLRQLISKWGIMSVDMQQAFAFDNAVADISSGNFEVTDAPTERLIEEPKKQEEPAQEPKQEPIQQDTPKVVSIDDL